MKGNKKYFNLNDIAEICEIGTEQVRRRYKALGIEPVRRIRKKPYFILEQVHKIKNYRRVTNRKVEVIEVPKLITKEITYYIFQSKLNFLTLEQL